MYSYTCTSAGRKVRLRYASRHAACVHARTARPGRFSVLTFCWSDCLLGSQGGNASGEGPWITGVGRGQVPEILEPHTSYG